MQNPFNLEPVDDLPDTLFRPHTPHLDKQSLPPPVTPNTALSHATRPPHPVGPASPIQNSPSIVRSVYEYVFPQSPMREPLVPSPPPPDHDEGLRLRLQQCEAISTTFSERFAQLEARLVTIDTAQAAIGSTVDKKLDDAEKKYYQRVVRAEGRGDELRQSVASRHEQLKKDLVEKAEEGAQNRLSDITKRVEGVEARLAQTQADLARTREELAHTQEKLAETQEELDREKANSAQVRDAHEERATLADDERRQTDAALTTLQKEVVDDRERAAKEKRIAAAATKKRKALEETIEGRLTSTETTLKLLANQKADTSVTDELQARVDGLQGEARTLKKRVGKAEDEAAMLSSKVADHRYDADERLRKADKAITQATADFVARLADGLSKLDRDWKAKLEVNQDLRTVIERAAILKARLDHVEAYVCQAPPTDPRERYDWEWEFRQMGKRMDARTAALAAEFAPLRFRSVPWPMASRPASIEDLTRQAIRSFLVDDKRTDKAFKEKLKDMYMRWHPDKWSNIMKTVSQAELEDVKAGVDVVAGILNELKKETR